ncbi:prostatic acid phosphatase-like [Oppia nitens]|uniref:prostatic acid phosphatase-like n=1 Tax=Oppia nitens TaxID=1686743 RepID=UPI0023DAACBA|nr:prostatic acid phosphatase-like [Oppia nitens]
MTDSLTLFYRSTEDMSTLRLVQLVHRHGDRNPLEFSPNDPFKGQHFWKEGIGGLTAKGKQRMYRLGKFIRKRYHRFLGHSYSPRDVYVRSSISERCVESVQCLMSGVYPPKSSILKWSNGSKSQLGNIWQPIPVQTFIPKSEDIVLNRDKRCPIVERELQRIYNSLKVQKFVESMNDFYEYLSPIVGHKIDCIKKAKTLHSTLDIEINSGFYWTHIWTKGEEQRVVRQLYESHLMSYRLVGDSPLILRLRAGGLIKELMKNILKLIGNQLIVKKFSSITQQISNNYMTTISTFSFKSTVKHINNQTDIINNTLNTTSSISTTNRPLITPSMTKPKSPSNSSSISPSISSSTLRSLNETVHRKSTKTWIIVIAITLTAKNGTEESLLKEEMKSKTGLVITNGDCCKTVL